MLAFFILIFIGMGIFRSYVDTVFLERYGPGEIPVMMLVNGVLTIALFWLVGLLPRPPGSSLVAWFLIVSAALIAALYFVVAQGSRSPYPVLWQLLNLQDSFFLVYLWNVAGSLFDVRQGKRLFPLLMAGQVLGSAVGSFLVVPLAGIAGSDFLLVVVAVAYFAVGAGLLSSAAAFTGRGGARAPVDENTNKRPSEILALVRKYPIIRYLVACAFFPGILLPVFTYQFYVIAHATFSSEPDLLAFLSVYRGAITVTTFVLLFAVGRLYARFGLARSAFIQPVNFLTVFAGLSAWFGIYVAAYGQFSVVFIQRAVAGPMNKVFVNAVPRRLYAWTRVFTGGTVANFSLVVSGLVMVGLQRELDAHQMAYLAAAFSVFWILETVRFRRRFASGLRQVLADRAVEYEKLEAEQAVALDVPYTAVREQSAHTSTEPAAGAAAGPAGPADADAALALLDHPDLGVRTLAATSLAGTHDPRGLEPLLAGLGDRTLERRAAVEALAGYVEHYRPYLEVALLKAPPPVQLGILEAMKAAGETRLPLSFIRRETAEACQRLQFIECLRQESPCLSLRMLTDHLRQDNDLSLRLIFHAVSLHLTDARLILESLHTGRAAVAIELLEDSLSPDMARLVLLLVDDVPVGDKLARGKDLIALRAPLELGQILAYLGTSDDATTRMLAAFAIGQQAPDDVGLPTARRLAEDAHEHVREAARYALTTITKEDAVLPETIFDIDALSKVPLFRNISIRALEAIASSMQQKFYKPGAVVIGEGDEADHVYCIVSGGVNVVRGRGTPDEILVRTLAEGDVFGELPLLTGGPSREAYVVADDYIEVSELDFEHMRDIMMLYPTVAINIARSLALRLEGP